MDTHHKDSTQRFSDRVQDYVRYRPGYPEGIIDLLQQETDLSPASIVADIGSGTGKSTELFLRNGNHVYAVEPNNEMRMAAEADLGKYPRFFSVAGTAEATTLASNSIDYVIAAQAFHWFNLKDTKPEFLRILKSNAWIVLFWNRRVKTTPFQAAYEDLLQQYGNDYQQVKHTNIDEATLHQFLGPYEKRVLKNRQVFDFVGLRGRLLSSSYTPTEVEPNYWPMLEELQRIFDQFAEDNRIWFDYNTEVYFGRVSKTED